MSSSKTVDTVAYQSVYNTLLSTFTGIPGKFVSSEKIKIIIRKIEIRNNELNKLITTILTHMNIGTSKKSERSAK